MSDQTQQTAISQLLFSQPEYRPLPLAEQGQHPIPMDQKARKTSRAIPEPPPHIRSESPIGVPAIASARSRRLSAKREGLRNQLWPGSADIVWSRHRDKGFTTIPRSLPLVMRIINELTPKGDASRVYLELWARSFDEGLVTVHDEHEMAFGAGYDGPRAVRTWREHIEALVSLGFIWTRIGQSRYWTHPPPRPTQGCCFTPQARPHP